MRAGCLSDQSNEQRQKGEQSEGGTIILGEQIIWHAKNWLRVLFQAKNVFKMQIDKELTSCKNNW